MIKKMEPKDRIFHKRMDVKEIIAEFAKARMYVTNIWFGDGQGTIAFDSLRVDVTEDMNYRISGDGFDVYFDAVEVIPDDYNSDCYDCYFFKEIADVSVANMRL